MAKWGYEKAFTIEHDPTLKKKICCKDCFYYEKLDCSCRKLPLYLPEDGYDSWKTCGYFDLLKDVSNYEEKQSEYLSFLHKKSNKQNKKISSKQPFFDKYVFFVPVEDIIVPQNYLKHIPKGDKTESIKKYYETFHTIDKPILVSEEKGKYILKDGYVRLFVGQEKGIDMLPVVLDSPEGKLRNTLCKKDVIVKHKSFGIGFVERYDLKNVVIKFPSQKSLVKLNINFCIDNKLIQIQ